MSKGIIVLDPGHGPKSNRSPAITSYYEGAAMYNYALILKKFIEMGDYTVLITRNNINENPSLTTRGKMAGNNNALLFLSLHSNAVASSRNDNVTGVNVFYSLQNKEWNEPISVELGTAVATLMGNKFRGALIRPYPNNPNLDYYGVLRSAAQSGCSRALLIEHGFHTAYSDTLWLLNDENLTNLAIVESSIIIKYLDGLVVETPPTSPLPSISSSIAVGSSVVISKGAVYGGLSSARGMAIPSQQLAPKEHTVSKVKLINDTQEALLKEISSWVSLQYLSLADKEIIADNLYRVRITWDNSASQKGAFSSLEKAKELADTLAAEQYKVFNSSGAAVYIPQIKQEVAPPVLDPSVPEKDEIIEDIYNLSILGQMECSLEQMVGYLLQVNPKLSTAHEIAKAFYDLGEKYGIRGDIALAQSCHETGHFTFTGDVKATQNNFAGLGATGGVPGLSFSSINEGVAAQLQHLWAYATKEDLPTGWVLVDPRFKYVSLRGSCPTWVSLSGKWAVPGYSGYNSLEDAILAKDSYGHKIINIYNKILHVDTSSVKLSVHYSDIPAGHWSIDAFDRATELGIFTPISEGKAGFSESLARTVQMLLNTIDYLRAS